MRASRWDVIIVRLFAAIVAWFIIGMRGDAAFSGRHPDPRPADAAQALRPLATYTRICCLSHFFSFFAVAASICRSHRLRGARASL